MLKPKKILGIIGVTVSAGIVLFGAHLRQSSLKTVIAIANYGPHSSLTDSIEGLKKELEHQGFSEQNVRYVVADVGFDPLLIPQMIQQLKSHHPKVFIALTTPVAQAAQQAVTECPVIFLSITDPISAGLLAHPNQPAANLTGASDRECCDLILSFAKQVLPHAKAFGILYATGEANSVAMMEDFQKAAQSEQLKCVVVPIDQAREIPSRMQLLRKEDTKVDFLYIGAGGPIQPSLPTIVVEADRMKIPIFNLNVEAVKNQHVLGSFGVDYHRVGASGGRMVAHLLKGGTIKDLPPSYPTDQDCHRVLSEKQIKRFAIFLPDTLKEKVLIIQENDHAESSSSS